MSETVSAHEALASARAAQAKLAAKVDCPPQFHAAFGALMGTLVLAQAFPPAATIAIEVACMGGAGLMYVVGRRRLGFFVNGYRKGKTRPIIFGMLAVYVVTLGLAGWLKMERHLIWPAVVGGLFMFGVGVAASVAWQRTYKAELLAGEVGASR